MVEKASISKAMSIKIEDMFDDLPEMPEFTEGIRRAPTRHFTLSPKDTQVALKNALRYIPEDWHQQLAPEFLEELITRGRIYGYRFRPGGPINGKPVDEYEGSCIEGQAFQVMIDNNLDFDVALYPYELVTYGETGQVCQNWMQYRLIKKYLAVLTREQTLVVESGHPLGLFASSPDAPRVILTNGLMVGCFDDPENWSRAAALGVSNYGQMTAGGWMYIGPQGIVHGTYSTILNAGRDKLGIPDDQDLAGRLFVTSGLGGMSGAQGKAIEIANGTDYALTGGLYSRSPGNIERVKREFRVGNLYVNRKITGALVGRQPFGGLRMSGIGSKAGGPDYLLQFMESHTVTESTIRTGFAPELEE